MTETVGILHPGLMGVSVAAAAQAGGQAVLWASQGRSPATKQRAESQGLADAGTLEALCQSCSVIVSICPPGAAEQVADAVLDAGFRGLFVDANATSPQRAQMIAERMAAAGVDFIDGGIVGPPAWKPRTAWLYLSGRQSERAASCFTDGLLEVRILGDDIGRASALKMCYGAYTKGTTALLAGILGTAEALGVRGELERHWTREDRKFVDQTHQRVRRSTAKAWRFVDEMGDIAATFESAGLPGGFHRAAAEVFARLADFKDRETLPEVAEVLEALKEVSAS
jgi:3-hydroxyisobutyrate dehydrogenase-like beta-hydroxyacid dehydrogenase